MVALGGLLCPCRVVPTEALVTAGRPGLGYKSARMGSSADILAPPIDFGAPRVAESPRHRAIFQRSSNRRESHARSTEQATLRRSSLYFNAVELDDEEGDDEMHEIDDASPFPRGEPRRRTQR
jgi:hypothetical protein